MKQKHTAKQMIK